MRVFPEEARHSSSPCVYKIFLRAGVAVFGFVVLLLVVRHPTSPTSIQGCLIGSFQRI